MAVVGAGVFAVVAVAAGGTAGISLGRSVGDIAYWGAHLRDYLPAPINSPSGSVAARLDSSLRSVNYPGAEGPMYPGLLTALLAVGWIVWLLRGRVEARWLRVASWSLVGVVVVSVVFAMPNPMRVLGVDIHPMPSLLVLKVVPAFRVPTRLAALLLAALIPLAALALGRLCTALRRRVTSPRAGVLAVTALCVVACALSLVELAFLPMPLSRIGGAPAAYAALVEHTPPGVLAEYPLEVNMSPHSENSAYLYWQKAHGRALLNGAGRGTAADSIRRMLVDPRAPGTAPSLAWLGVTAIVTRPTTFDWDQVSNVADVESYGAGYELVRRFPGDVRVWRVTARPAPAIVAYRGGDVDEPFAPAQDGFVGYPVSTSVVHLDIYAKTSGLVTLHLSARAKGSAGTLQVRGRVGLRTIGLANGRGALSVPIMVRRGRSTLTITVGASDRSKATAGVRCCSRRPG